MLAPLRSTVILVGATGTGKTFLARHIHRLSPRHAEPFLDRTAAEITEELGPSQLFGHERGAFTGAHERRSGLFTTAAGGTLLLDELHLMPLRVQALLLRALGERVFCPVGSARPQRVNCRLVAGMRECPDALVERGVLLPDLRYRLGKFVIRLAPLAERREEIRFLAEAHLARCPELLGVPGPTRFAADVIPALECAPWPGNVRELEASVEFAFAHARGDDRVRLAHFGAEIARAGLGALFRRHGDREVNHRAVHAALSAAGGSRAEAARLLSVTRKTVGKYVDRSRGERSPK